MFFISRFSDTIRIPPKMFGKPLKKSAETILQERYSSRIDPKSGFVISVDNIVMDGKGLVSMTGETIHKVEFDAITFLPTLHEIILGEVIEIADFGAFVRIGPTDAVLHVSQISSSPSRVDRKSGMIFNPDLKNPMRIGTRIRARITAASYGKDNSMKIGLTCSEQTLGPQKTDN